MEVEKWSWFFSLAREVRHVYHSYGNCIEASNENNEPQNFFDP